MNNAHRVLCARALGAVLCASLCAGAFAQEPPAPLELLVLPPAVLLDGARDQQAVVVLARAADGTVADVTARAEIAPAAPGIAEVRRDGGGIVLRPAGDGRTELVACLGELGARVPVEVRGASTAPPVSFRNEVVPALTRAGCNAGSCHGSAAGKNGFALTLFGYDPASDHRMLTRELRGRRLDLAAPERSLMLQKACARVTHQGGKRLEPDGALYAVILRWIEQGAADDGASAPALAALDVLPEEAVLAFAGRPLQLLVRARYADGSDRDVTALALWSSNNEGTAAVADTGLVRTGRRGEAAVLARFGGMAAAARLLVHADSAPFAWPDEPAANFVDEHVHGKLRRARALPAPLCDDATFLRRVHLDLIGLLPTPDETRAFLADPRADKRDRMVDALLGRPAFAALHAMRWAEVLQVDRGTMQAKGAALLGRWLRAAFAGARPFDEVVRDLLCAEGATFRDAPANFHLIERQPHLVAERAAQVFLGVQLQCAQCHNHPFERWTMDDYYGFAAFFAQTGKKRALDPDEWIVWDRRSGEVRNRRTGEVAAPRLLGAGEPAMPRGTDRRAVLAEWLAAGDNPFFARNVVNRVFANLMGRGLIDPVDSVRVGNPASHPALLDALAALFVERGFDVRPVIAAICKSRTYQRQRAAGADPALFAGYEPRRLSAEPLLDAIAAVTGVANRYPGLPEGSPASAIDAGRAGIGFLDTFGRPDRTSACTCDRSDAPTLGQVLHLINGDTIARKLADDGGRLRRALAADTAPAAMLEDLFLAAYCRPPGEQERERLLAFVAAAGEPRAAWEDVYWSVLNSKEFLFQH